jgi:hypothetical protein
MIHISRRIVSPRHILLLGLALWGAVWLLAPMDFETRRNDQAALLLVGFLLAFFVGASVIATPNAPTETTAKPAPPRNFATAYWILLALALLGLALRFFDLFFLKSYAEFESAAEFRLATSMGGGDEPRGPISIISAGMYPLAVIVFICGLYFRHALSRVQFWAGAAVMAPFFAYVVMTGARAPMFSALLMIGVAAVLAAGRGGWRIRYGSAGFWRLLLVPVLAMGLFIAYFAQVMAQRQELVGLDESQAIAALELTRNVRVHPSVAEADPQYASLAEGGLFLTFYFVHGVYYFHELVDHAAGTRPLLGQSQYYVFFRFLDAAQLTDSAAEDLSRYPYIGMFYTFFGNVLLDWGPIGAIAYCFLLGMLAQWIWLRAMAGRILAMLLYPLVASIIFHFLITDMLAGGAGSFYLIDIFLAAGVIAAAARWRRGERKMRLRAPEATPL